MIEGMVLPDHNSSSWWRRLAATMAHVDLAYRRLPAPVKALLWLVPAAVARLLNLSWPRWW